MKQTGGPIFQAMIAGAIRGKYRFITAPNRPMLFAFFEGRHGYFVCAAEAFEQQQVAVFYTQVTRVPQVRRVAVAEYIARANYGLLIGCFEQDLRDGEVRYRTMISAATGAVAPEQIQALIAANVATVDRYVPGLMAVAFASVEAGDAIDMLETFDVDSVVDLACELMRDDEFEL